MNEMTIAWVYTLLAAVCEACWLLSLKYLNMKDLTSFKWLRFENFSDSMTTILPFIGYLTFGLANVICFSMAAKKLPMAVIFASWLAVALIITTTIDITYFKENYSMMQLLCIIVILIGVIGLKMSTNS